MVIGRRIRALTYLKFQGLPALPRKGALLSQQGVSHQSQQVSARLCGDPGTAEDFGGE